MKNYGCWRASAGRDAERSLAAGRRGGSGSEFTAGRCSIVQVNGRTAGYVEVEDRGDHLFLGGIYLNAEHRRKGLGSALLRDLIERARKGGKPLRLRPTG